MFTFLNDLIRQIFLSLFRHKLRSSLALIGIIWGTVAIILLLALGNGFYAANIKNLSFLNNGTLFIWTGTTSKPFAGLPPGQTLHIQENILRSITQNIKKIKSYSPVYVNEKNAFQSPVNGKIMVQGVAPSFSEMQHFQSEEGGRFINDLDMAQINRVAFIDAQVKKTFFGEKKATGSFIYIDGIPFMVIGSEEPNQKGMMMWMTNSIYIPSTTFLSLWGPQDVNLFFILPNSVNDASLIKNNLKNMLAMQYQFDPTDEEALMIPNMENAQVFFKWFFRVIEIFLGFCGVLTLSVGGLSIANMMFLIVTERTREIGLRLALGAQDFHLMLQFMLETLIIVGLGGGLGFMFSFFCISVLQNLSLPEWLGSPHISLLTVIITIGILVFVAIAAGFFPARKAAYMKPVEALSF